MLDSHVVKRIAIMLNSFYIKFTTFNIILDEFVSYVTSQ